MTLQPSYSIPKLPPLGVDFQTPELLKALVAAHRHLAELKGCAASIPNQAILINTLALQEAKASSEVESYVTTQDELFQADLHIAEWISPAAKEVSRYREALRHGFDRMREQQGILGNGTLIALFQLLKNSGETFRTNGARCSKMRKPAQRSLCRRKTARRCKPTCRRWSHSSTMTWPATWTPSSRWR